MKRAGRPKLSFDESSDEAEEGESKPKLPRIQRGVPQLPESKQVAAEKTVPEAQSLAQVAALRAALGLGFVAQASEKGDLGNMAAPNAPGNIGQPGAAVPTTRLEMQQWQTFPFYMRQSQWDFLTSDARQLKKIKMLAEMLVAYGLRCPSERAQTTVCALLCHTAKDAEGREVEHNVTRATALLATVKSVLKDETTRARQLMTPLLGSILGEWRPGEEWRHRSLDGWYLDHPDRVTLAAEVKSTIRFMDTNSQVFEAEPWVWLYETLDALDLTLSQ
eukprot:s564_g12.t1